MEVKLSAEQINSKRVTVFCEHLIYTMAPIVLAPIAQRHNSHRIYVALQFILFVFYRVRGKENSCAPFLQWRILFWGCKSRNKGNQIWMNSSRNTIKPTLISTLVTAPCIVFVIIFNCLIFVMWTSTVFYRKDTELICMPRSDYSV